jgi:hypothetical protein
MTKEFIMRRALVPLAALALAAALVASPPEAKAETSDCTKVIDGFYDMQFAVGITKTKTNELALWTLKGCGVQQAAAVIKAPRKTYRVTLTKTGDDEPGALTERWAGTFSVSPRTLRNSDAGAWPLTYRVTGDHPESTTIDGFVRRATRASFNAGPEPVKNDTIAYSGKLERADWTAHRYRGISRSVEVQTVEPGDHEYVDVATFRTRKDGTYRHTQRFPGPNSYWLTYAGTKATAGTSSKPDHVTAS